MAARLVIPNVLGLNTEGMEPGTIIFLQAMQDALNTVDQNVLYRDQVDTIVPRPTIRAKSAQGQSFSVANTILASGEDYAALVADFERLLQGYLQLHQAFTDFVKEVRGE